MPRINKRGESVAGAGGLVSVDGGDVLAQGWLAQWLDDDTIIYATEDSIESLDVRTGEVVTLAPHGANNLAAGGGQWLARANGIGLIGALTIPTAGTSLPYADGRGSIGRDGTLAFVRDFHAGGPTVLKARDGSEVEIHAPAYGLDVLGKASAVWTGGAMNAPQPPSGAVSPKVCGAWMVYYRDGQGLVARRIGTSLGVVLEAGLAFNHDAVAMPDGDVRACWSVTQGEAPNDLRTARVSALPLVDLDVSVPVDPIPAVNRALWFGSFDLDKNATFPGNCRIVRTDGVPWLMLETMDGKPIARYVAGDPDGDPEAIERAIDAARGPLPVLSYVPTGVRLPRNLDWLGLEAYQKTWETPAQFEALRIGRAQEARRPVVLIGQTYSSNSANVSDLRPLVPIFGRFLRDVPNCVGFVAFSAGHWRRTGFEDHPEIHAAYQELARTIRTPEITQPQPTPIPVPEPIPEPIPSPLDPPVPTPIPEPEPIPVPIPPDEEDPMRPPAVTVDRWTLDELVNGREMAFHDRDNPELGYRARVFVKDGSVHAEISNNVGTAQTGQRRPVKAGNSQPAPNPQPQPSPVNGVSLRTVNGFYLTVVDGVLRSTPQPSGFTFEAHGDRYALKVNGRYLRAVDGGGKELRTDRDEAGAHELFMVFREGDDIAIQTQNGKFVSAVDGGNGEVKANQPRVGGWERFRPNRPFDQAPTRAALQGRIRPDGRFLVNDAGTFRPLFVSAFGCLTQLREGREGECARYLDWAAETGFNGIRIFGGALSWQGQSAQAAREHLPRLLALAAERGLYVEVSAITDSGAGYNVREHVDAIARVCSDAGNAIIEVANEPYHGTQTLEVHDFRVLSRLGRELCATRGLTWASGAWETDEPLPAEVSIDGDFLTLHLDRGRDEWNMVRRIRELEAASANYNRFVMNNEPIGWFEQDVPGRRESNHQIAFTMGVLCRGFEVGMVSHADHALTSAMPGPVQRACHEAVVRGFRCIPTDARLAFRNAGWGGSDVPVQSANFDRVVRAYSFLENSNRGWTVLLGITGDPAVQWGNGWRVGGTVADEGQVRVLEIVR